ncbi:STELLO glycosyltransferase family protein [Magnetococcus sp. PR-3]|uniref:STELLO glycosyltransferase family protein n=1 Tax=Magnetococcus sp. PR-3 TaxID=3120355 RepID=UPI002FCE319E
MKTTLVVTSINAPNPVMQALAKGCADAGYDFILAGDSKSPSSFALDGCDFLSLEQQRASRFRLGQSCPTKHYARKNIAYLKAIAQGTERILETDDDNWPRAEFFADRNRQVQAPTVDQPGWLNVYGLFLQADDTQIPLWPRGLPLDTVRNPLPELGQTLSADCPIQQGLADDNPDVDAIYRLTLPLPRVFEPNRQVVLNDGVWCPFNSQNTLWWRDAFPLLYLPATCSFRMTDIWRSFVAQRLAWSCGWKVLFFSPTVWQERNEHDLNRDFRDEVPGYLHNADIAAGLAKLDLPPGTANLTANLRTCYQWLVEQQLMEPLELTLVEDWISDLADCGWKAP